MRRGRILLLIHFIVVVIVTTLYPWDVKQETEERCIKRKFIPSVETLKEKKSFFMEYINRLLDFFTNFLKLFPRSNVTID